MRVTAILGGVALCGQLAVSACSADVNGPESSPGATPPVVGTDVPSSPAEAPGVTGTPGAVGSPAGEAPAPGSSAGLDPATVPGGAVGDPTAAVPAGPSPVDDPGVTTPEGDPPIVGPTPQPLDCSEPQAAATRLRVLSESQFSNTVHDLFQLDTNPGAGLGLGVDDISLELRMNVAGQVAMDAVANFANWAPCTPEADAACADQIIDRVGSQGFRRPLSDAEREQFQTLFDAGVAAGDFATGVEWFITGLLQSPDFTYEVVRPAATEQPGEVLPLAPHEYATRLAYFIWDGPPDDELMAAASRGELADVAQRDAQLARMVADARATRGVEQFYSHWLPVSGFSELARDADGFDPTVVDALHTSLLMSVTSLYASAAPNLSDLFSGDTYFLNDVLRDFYGAAGTGTDFAPTPMVGEGRRGILTHPALMALLARPSESNPISRGLFLLRSVLCVDIPAPQGLEIPDLPPVSDGVSTRERLEMHVADPTCSVCHNMIDPAGFSFESFDEVGRFRTLDHGRAVDTSGTLTLATDTDGPFATGDELFARIAESQSVRECFAGHYVGFGLTRPRPDPADACSLRSVTESFAASGDLRRLISSVATSDSFRMRLAEGVGQ